MAQKYTKGYRGYYSAKVWDGTYTAKGKKHYKTLRTNKSSRTLEELVKAFEKEVEDRGGQFPEVDPNINLDTLAKDWLRVCKSQSQKATLEMYERNIKKFGELGRTRITDRERAFIQLILGCGLRRGEALALRPSDFDFSTNTLCITKAVGYYHGEPEIKETKNYVSRELPVPPATITAVRNLILSSGIRDRSYLFPALEDSKCSMRGDLLTQGGYKYLWEGIVQKISSEAKIATCGLTAHVFRHNYCTRLCYEIPKISTKKIAALLGDTETMVLKVYSHILEEKEDLSGAMKAIEIMTG